MSEKKRKLGDLKQKIKEVMIPLLVEIFEAKLAASSTNALPSRLTPKAPKSREELRKELEALQSDIKQLTLWCQSCESQIAKALEETKEPTKFSYSVAKPTAVSSAVSQSFSQTIGNRPLKRRLSLSWIRNLFSVNQ
jgi:hypothetical protein